MKKLLLLLGFTLMGNTWVNAQAQTAEPPRGMAERAAYSLFVSNYRNQDYQGALEYGRWILLSMPESIEGYGGFDLSVNLGRFVNIYSALADDAEDTAQKAAYIDTVQTIFTKTFDNLSEDQINLYSWRIRQGRFHQDYADLLGDNAMEKAMEAYAKAFALNPEKMATSSNGYYLKVLLRNLAEKNTEQAKQKAIAIITEAEPYANENLNEEFNDIRAQIFDEPAEQIAYLERQLQENPQDTTALKQLHALYTRQGQTQKAREINKKLYELNPTYQNIVSLANFAGNQGNYQQQSTYLKEALNKTEDPEKLKTIYFNLADAQMSLGNLRQAANYANQTISIDSDWGRPYLKLAVIYARTVRNCAEGRSLTNNDRAVYWLVIDYIQQAKRVDPSVSNRANTLLQSYRPVTPSSDAMFFEGWAEGTSIRVDASLGQCYAWINETTTAR